MARGKKKETLTPEERLQAALVPESEQPYKVPKNWCWTKVGDLCIFVGGGTPDKTNPLYWNGNIPWASVKDIKGRYLYSTIDKISQLGLECSSSNLCEAGDLLLVTRIEPAKAIVSKIVTAINQDLKIVKSELSSLFLYYYFCTFQHEFERKASGSTVKGITLPNILNTPFPLPPLSEQQRIVDRIESLFAKLDEAKQKAQEALDSFETRKAAILHKAFTGELTAQWRKEHGVGMESWSWIPLKKCGSWNGGGTPSMSHPEYWENGTLLWVTSKDMKSDLIEDTLMHTHMLGVENSSATYIEEPAVLFVMRSGILRRIFPVCMVKKPFTVNQDLKALVPTVDINLEYLFWACKANEKQILEKCMKSGTTVESINTAALRDFEIPIARKNEQTEIVRILDDLLAKEQQAKEAAEGVLEQIDLIKKAILARAFRGELGTNGPTEENAVKLLCSWD